MLGNPPTMLSIDGLFIRPIVFLLSLIKLNEVPCSVLVFRPTSLKRRSYSYCVLLKTLSLCRPSSAKT